MPRRIVVDTLVMLPLLILTAGLSPAAKLPLGEAVVVSPPNLSGPERKAVEMLLDEVEKRTQVRWQVVDAWPADDTPVVAVGPASKLSRFAGKYAQELSSERGAAGAEGYRIRVRGGREAPAVLVVGNDSRGVLFGVGRLLRNLRMSAGRIELPDDFDVTTAPEYPLRGHQLGYRPKTNSYDGWTVPM